MDKLNHLIELCGLLIILLSCALTNVTATPVTSTTERSRHTTTGILTANISNSLSNNSVQNISSTTTPSNSYSETSTTPNSTTSNSLSNSTMTSPTVQTQITTVQINSSITDTTPTSLATQPASKPATTSVSNTSLTTLSSSAVTVHGNESTSGTAATNLTTEKAPGNKTNNETTGKTGASLRLPEKSMTILFSVILGVIVLLVLGQIVYKVSRNKHRSVQYSHRPLYNEDTGEHFVVPDDTLVISGGLYDGPQIYNPTVTALNDEDQLTFSYTPTQLRLEFLHEEQGTDQDYEANSFETFKTTDTSHN